MTVQQPSDLYIMLIPERPQPVQTLALLSASVASHLSLKKASRALITAC